MNRKIIATAQAVLAAGAVMAQQPITIVRQGEFTVGGQTIQRDGVYDNSKFVGWVEQDETGQSYRGDHAYVEYQIPQNAHKTSLIFIHGYGGSGACWQTTPDGRDGFQTLMLRHGWPTYVMDLPGRGRASRAVNEAQVKPVADEMFWFDIWRMGVWPKWNDGVQFPRDSVSLSQFFRLMVPNLSNGQHDVPSIRQTVERVGESVLVTHSAGGILGWLAGFDPKVKAIAAYEPGGYVFPAGEVPDPIQGLTGGVRGVEIPAEQFAELCKKPIVLYFGDYIPDTVSDRLGDENWRVRLQMARLFVECVNRHGGKATLVELPKEGIRGNTHFLMLDLNNDVLADMLDKWINENVLMTTDKMVQHVENPAQRADMPFEFGRTLPADRFHGEAWRNDIINLDSLYNFPQTNVITFSPGAHSDWHRHGAMDILVTAGAGIYQEEGQPAQIIRRGDVLHIPAGVRHWHGAAPGSWFQQIVTYDSTWQPATDYADGDNTVSDEYYASMQMVEYRHQNKSDLSMFAPGDSLLQLPTFTGPVRLSTTLGSDNVSGAPEVHNVVFEPGVYNAWHEHAGGQILLITDGTAYHQIEGQPVEVLHAGDVAKCPPGVRHWHGAAPVSRMAHLATNTNPDRKGVKWYDFLSKEEYDKIRDTSATK